MPLLRRLGYLAILDCVVLLQWVLASAPTGANASLPPTVHIAASPPDAGGAAAAQAITPTATVTATATAVRATATKIHTPTASRTPSRTATSKPAATTTKLPSATATRTPTLTATPTLTRTATLTPTLKAATQITTSLGAEIDIDPQLGGELNVGDGAVVVQVPAGAFVSTHRLLFERLKADRQRDASAPLVLSPFSLGAINRATGKETTQFAKAVTIQVRYDPKWVQGWQERDLTLAYWDAQRTQWIPLASTVDGANHTVTAQTTHFTDYGLVAGPNLQPYLPHVQSAEPNLFVGAATASYDIEVPPGRKGLAPKLSLSYSSSAIDMMDAFQQSSLVGTGWSFSNSYIGRDLRSTVGGEDDVFSLVLNGSGYDLVKGTDGYYHTSQEQYWRISFDGANNRWLVTMNDGTQHQYGYSSNSRAIQYLRDGDPEHVFETTYAWWLERVIDTHNNQIKYTYLHDVGTTNCYAPTVGPKTFDNALYPQTIQYNGAGSSFLTTLEFSNTLRNDYRAISTNVQCAVPLAHQKLSRIDVKTTDNTGAMQLVRRYEFGYDESLFPGYADPATHDHAGSTGRLALKTITQKGSDGSSVLSTYTANYADNRLASVANGFGGVTSFTYHAPHVFNDGLSHRPVWAWNFDQIEDGTMDVTPDPVQGVTGLRGDGSTYAVLRAASFIPGAYHVGAGNFQTGYSGPCSVRMSLWDGVRETWISDWWTPPLWEYGYYGSFGGGFILAGDARALELRIYANGVDCRFAGGTATLYRTYYRAASRTVYDGQGHAATTTYAYEGAQLNYTTISAAAATENPRVSRYTQFRGHSRVTVTDPTGAQTEHHFRQDDVLLGRVWQTYQKSASGATYTRTESQFGQRVIGVQQQCAPPQCASPVTGDVSNHVYTATAIRDTYDGQPSHRRARTVSTPDDYGNIIQTDEYDGTGALYRRMQQTFYPNTTKWILNQVGVKQILAGGTTRVAETRHFYDGAPSYTTAPITGTLTRVDVTDDGTRFSTQSTMTYDAYGNPTSVTDALGHTTTTACDTMYHLFPTTVTSPPPFSHVTTNTYNYRFGQLASTTDPNGAVTSYTYDVFGRKASITAPLDQGGSATATYTYAFCGNRALVRARVRRDAGGTGTAVYQTATYFYDGLGRVIQHQADGLHDRLILTNTAYDAMGRVKRQSLPYAVPVHPTPVVGYKIYLPLILQDTAVAYPPECGEYRAPDSSQPYTEHVYDPIGREVETIHPDHSSRTMSYLQWETTVTDANGHQKKTLADAFGRIYQVLEYNGGATYTTDYAYDELDRLIQVTDHVNNVTTLSYDWLGRKTGMTDPDLGAWAYAYDDNGNLTRQTDAKNQTTCLYYDALNRLMGKTYRGDTSCPADPGTYTVSYAYDQGTYGKGRRTGMSNGVASTTWVYDQQGRPTSRTDTIAGLSGNLTTQWAYDAQDRAIQMTYPGGEVVSLPWNEQGLPASVSGIVTATDYNAAGQLTRMDLQGGTQTTYDYSPQTLRLRQLTTSGGLQDLTYAYDPVGNVTAITDTVRSEVSAFAYDHLDRLMSATLTGGSSPYTAGWSYGPLGNITQRTQDGVPTNYSYGDGAHKHAVTQAGGTSYSYDANGNMTSRASDVLGYDAENRLVRVESGSYVTEYAYDADGSRVTKTVNGFSTYYVGNWYEVAENGAISKYYYLGGKHVALKDGAGNLTLVHADHLGSTAKTSGTVPSGQTYFPFGGIRTTDGEPPTDFAFTGQRLDAASALLYYGTRYYDASLGRFVQADTITADLYNPQSLNRYAYVLNNPIKYVDPTGHRVCVDVECKETEVDLPGPEFHETDDAAGYNPSESKNTGLILTMAWFLNMPEYRRVTFDMSSSFTKDVRYGSQMQRARAAWAAQGYPQHFEYSPTIDDRSGSVASMVSSAAVYAGEQGILLLSMLEVPRALGITTPGSAINPTGGILGSLDRVKFDVTEPGKVQVTVENSMDWESGSRVPGTNTSVSTALGSVYPTDWPRPSLGSTHNVQVFRWKETYP